MFFIYFDLTHRSASNALTKSEKNSRTHVDLHCWPTFSLHLTRVGTGLDRLANWISDSFSSSLFTFLSLSNKAAAHGGIYAWVCIAPVVQFLSYTVYSLELIRIIYTYVNPDLGQYIWGKICTSKFTPLFVRYFCWIKKNNTNCNICECKIGESKYWENLIEWIPYTIFDKNGKSSEETFNWIFYRLICFDVRFHVEWYSFYVIADSNRWPIEII